MSTTPKPILLAASLLLAAPFLTAQSTDGYVKPSSVVEDILTRDAHTDHLENLSPDGRFMLIPIEAEFSTLEMMAQETYRLGMLELNPASNREWRLSTYGTRGFKVYSLEDRRERTVQLPGTIRLISDLIWSPDSTQVAFVAHLPERSEVWTLDISRSRATRLADAAVMATLAGRPRRGETGPALLQWTPEGGLITVIVPPGRGPEPDEGDLPPGPLVRRTREKPTPTPTYPFLLRTPHDAALFKYYTTSQLALLRPGQPVEPIGLPGMFLSFSLSPDGNHLLTERIVEPLSYITAFSNFGTRLEVLDLGGRVVSRVRDLPLREGNTRGDDPGPEGDLPRDVAWRPDDAGLSFLWREPKPAEGEEGGAPRGDRLMLAAAPFDVDAARTLVTTRRRFNDVSYTPDGRFALARLTGRDAEGSTRPDIVAYDLNASTPEPLVLAADIDADDPLADPGSVLTRVTPNGIVSAVHSSDGSAVYLEGDGYREDFRNRPFIDRVAIFSAEKQRVFEGAADSYQAPVAVLDADASRIVISQESPSDYPDNYLWARGGSADRLTNNSDPFVEVANARHIPFEFTRRDGLAIRGRIALPPGYQEGTRLPAVFWTYPREYANPKAYREAALRSHNLNAYKRLNYRNASEIWLTQGYAVVEPDIPILGEDNRYNDNYIAHLVDSMYGAIRKVDEMGYVDVDRLGHGGHSYGAFATANILARTPFFKAGIAGDGAFNRSLTPMGFQRERRFLWEATETILEMSPFFQADHIETPLLMYHGDVDNNTGTFLIQSERLMQALTGLGKTAVLYIYPFESHGPRAIETYLDLWARWLEWFDKYVKAEESEAVSDRGR